jgi:hypothetical protein
MVLSGSHPSDLGLGLNPTQELIFFVAAVLVIGIVLFRFWQFARRREFSGNVIVRCRDGHVFTTTWIPGVSFKAIRLGLVRGQYCPVGEHFTFVRPVSPDDLTPEERRMAAMYNDGNIP